MDPIQTMLNDRGSRYGEFNEHGRITQEIKKTLTSSVSWDKCTPAMKEALEMIAHKIGRIVNGDPYYADSWVDIVGYTQLVINDLNKIETKNKGSVIAVKSQAEFNKVTSMSPAEYRRWQDEQMQYPDKER